MSSLTVDKNSVVITSDEFDKEGDEYTKKALQELQEQMKEKPINTNINIKKSHNYNLRNRKKNLTVKL